MVYMYRDHLQRRQGRHLLFEIAGPERAVAEAEARPKRLAPAETETTTETSDAASIPTPG